MTETYPAYMVDDLRTENAELRQFYSPREMQELRAENEALRKRVSELCARIAELSAELCAEMDEPLQERSLAINNEWKALTPGPFDRLGDDISTRKPTFLED